MTENSARQAGSSRGERPGLLRSLFGRSERRAAPSVPAPEPEPCDQIAGARLRREVRLRGTITILTINPRGVNRWLEAVLNDGTGEITLVWMGRRMIRGVDAGRRVEVSGRIAMLDGRHVIYNPQYSLLPA